MELVTANPPASVVAARVGRELAPLLPGLRGHALRLTRNAADADDLVQETVLRAFRFWDRYQGGSNLGAWLHRILTNTFINRYRRARREHEVVAQLSGEAQALPAAPQAPDAERDVSDEVAASVQALPDEFRAVLWAVAVDDLSYREAADALGCPMGTVMSRLHRARRSLKQRLQPYAVSHGYATASAA